MQLTIEDISPVEKRVEFEVPWGEVAPRLDKAYGDLRRKVQLKGFRPGKVPREILEKLYRSSVEEEVAREVIELSIGRAVNEKQIAPVAPPRIDKLELKAGAPLKFSALVEVQTDVTPKDYTGIRLSRRPAQVTDAQVDEAIEAHRRRLTEFVPVEGRTQVGESDVVLAEVQGRVGTHKLKKRVAWVDTANEVGGPLPGLGTHLRGLPIDGQRHDVRYTIAADDSMRELAGKDVVLGVTVKEVRERKVPPLDDELAKDTGEAETLEGLRQKVRERLIENDKEAIKRELAQQLVKEIVAHNDFPIAKSTVNGYVRAMYERFQRELAAAGIDLESAALDPQRFEREVRADAEREARAGVLLNAIAERENISVGDADVQKKIAELAAARQENPKKVRADLEKAGRLAGLSAQIREEKTLDWLLAQAKIVDEAPERLVVTPQEAADEARGGSGKVIVTP